MPCDETGETRAMLKLLLLAVLSLTAYAYVVGKRVANSFDSLSKHAASLPNVLKIGATVALIQASLFLYPGERDEATKFITEFLRRTNGR